jgi:hypothetical protein
MMSNSRRTVTLATRWLGALALAAALLAFPGRAAAQVQTSGSENLGKVLLGVHPLGVAVLFDENGNTVAIYKLGLDVAGRIASTNALTFWLGGEFNIGGRAHFAQLEPGVFCIMTMEKLLHIPLVPELKFGLAGAADVTYGTPNAAGQTVTNTTGNFFVKFGGGIHYFVTRNIGLGLDMDLALGAAFDGNGNSAFAGYWDLLTGLRFAF